MPSTEQYEDRIEIHTAEGISLEVTLAGLGSRVLAGLLDELVRWAIMFTVLLLLVVAGLGVGELTSPGFVESDDSDAAFGIAVLIFVVVAFLAQFFYDVLFEVFAHGRTPGKMALGIRVLKESGRPVTFRTSCVRNFVRIADQLPFAYLVGMGFILGTKRNQRLGDIAASTIVVRDRVTAPSHVTPPPLPPRVHLARTVGWDLSRVNYDDVATVRIFLDRRWSLEPAPRTRLAADLAGRLRAKVAGVPGTMHPEDFLEHLVAAKSARG